MKIYSTKQRNILITGVGGPAGKACVHFFKKKGFYVVGIDMREVETHADNFRKVPPALDPAYISCLLSLIKEFNISLLIPTVTEELVFVARVKEEFEKSGCWVFISSPEIVEIANDKFLTVKFLEEKGIPVPKTVLHFYWDEFTRARNHKIEGRFSCKWFDLLETEVFFALLRDPDSAIFTVNKELREVTRFDYKTRFLLGGNIQISTETFETEIKYIPNRDLDDSLSYSFFFNIEKEIINKNIPFPVVIRMDYIYDKYSQYSYLSRKSSRVYMFTLMVEPFSFLRLKFGGKFLSRPQRNEFGLFIGLVYKLKL